MNPQITSNDFTQEQITEFTEAFALFDLDNDGIITTKELASALRSLSLNPTEEQLQEMIKQFDYEKEGLISIKEFIALIPRDQINKSYYNEEQILSVFQMYDKENTGLITDECFRYILNNLGETMTKDDMAEFYNYVDFEANGLINYNQFVKKLLEGI